MSVDRHSRWGTRAAGLYSEGYAERYRAHDEAIGTGRTVIQLAAWLRSLCVSFNRPIDVLDLGCGTGRYFHALVNVRRLTAIDVSAPMLERARHPVGQLSFAADQVSLIEGDFMKHEFEPGAFDLVYSVGVLAEHSPLDEALAMRVRRWLKRGGRFAFTAVHPLSPSVPRTLKRRAGEWLLSMAPGPALRRGVRRRLMSEGLYADEDRVRDVLTPAGLEVESIEPFESDVHHHLLAVAHAR